MAFDFLGTFNKSQFERFVSFARTQLPLIESRIQHNTRELARIGTLRFSFDASNIPNAVSADPETSLLGKLLAAYEVLGGNPFLDLRTRGKEQAVFVRRGSEALPASTMSSGEVLPSKGLRDAYSAELMRSLRTPVQDTLRWRFENLERRIRRALDYSDQLASENASLQVYVAAATVEGSLEFISNHIQQLFGDRTYRAIYDDANSDPLGLNTYAPFSQYDVEPSTDPAVGGPERVAELPRRQDSGFIGPGAKKGTST